MEKTLTFKNYLLQFIYSLVLFLIVCWSAACGLYAAGWTESIAFFMLAFFIISRNQEQCTKCIVYSICALALGRVALEIPVRAFDWSGSFYSIIFVITSIMGIILGAISGKIRKPYIFIISFIIFILVNDGLIYLWDMYMIK